jgi:hypothetical protein
MEFEGQIIKVCNPRTGTSQRTGNEWKTQGFVFEYKEHDTDPWHDKVYLETFDEKIMEQLVVGAVAKIGFRHKTREYEGRVFNDVQMNSFTLIGKPMEATAATQQPAGGVSAAPATNTPQTQQDAPSAPANNEQADDLPF